MKIKWSQLGGQLGMGVAFLGVVLLFLGWNGAASYNSVAAQFPYLISGGMAGLSLVVIGGALMVIDNQRRDRAALQATLREVRDALDKLAAASLGTTTNGGGSRRAEAEAAGLVFIGGSSFHRPSCPLLEGRGDLPTVPVEEAERRGLAGCRVCDSGSAGDTSDEYATAPTRRRRSR